MDGGDRQRHLRHRHAPALEGKLDCARPAASTSWTRAGSGARVFDVTACHGCVEIVVGTARGDRITGSARGRRDLRWRRRRRAGGGGGLDVITGHAGDDTITARDRMIDAVGRDGATDAVVADRFGLVARDCETVSRLGAWDAAKVGGSRRDLAAGTLPSQVGLQLP
jgi:hypothetical protein